MLEYPNNLTLLTLQPLGAEDMPGTGTLIGRQPTVEPILLECPECQRSFQDRSFCPNDGHLAVPSFTIGERYVVDQRLGQGGTSLVFGGHHLVLGKPVALKVLRTNHAEQVIETKRFLRAARLGGLLSHENIVVVHDFGRDETLGLVYLVMERLSGITVDDALKEGGPLPWERVIPILAQLCRALAEAHRQDVLHRDLNPRNIMLTTTSGRQDVVKLCDFGLSRSIEGKDRLTAAGLAVGTPAYMAPEQVRGDEEQDHRIDLYALGVTAYEMLSGRLPHEAPTSAAMIASKLTEVPVPLAERMPKDRELPPALASLIMRCLASRPDARPVTASQIEHELLFLGEGTSNLSGQLIGNYRVVGELGQGGMGIVYLAEHELIGNKAALKVLAPELAGQPDLVERFIQEARASSDVDSPAMPQYYDFGTLPDGRAYALMELVEGESVATRLSLRGPMGITEIQEVVRQTAAALSAAHKVGIIHRDIKPEHIMMCPHENGFQVKILDFGIAKMFGGTATKTQVGIFMGTPAYCAPEQVVAEPVSPATDVYALGACVYEMLTGRPPFSGEAGQVLVIKTQRDPDPISGLRPEVPKSVSATVIHMMQRAPGDRPLSMRAVIDNINTWPLQEVAPVDTAQRFSWKGLAIAGVLLTVFVVALAISNSMGGSDSSTPVLQLDATTNTSFIPVEPAAEAPLVIPLHGVTTLPPVSADATVRAEQLTRDKLTRDKPGGNGSSTKTQPKLKPATPSKPRHDGSSTKTQPKPKPATPSKPRHDGSSTKTQPKPKPATPSKPRHDGSSTKTRRKPKPATPAKPRHDGSSTKTRRKPKPTTPSKSKKPASDIIIADPFK